MTLKLRKRSLFPALVTAESPIVLTKAGSAYEFGLDIDALPASLDAIYMRNSFHLPYSGSVERSIESKLSDVINIKDFGAVCDGVTNDAPAIQAAINALGSTGGVIMLPTGSIKINSAITISTSHVTIQGAGREATVITSASGGHSFSVSSGTVGTTLVGFKLTRTTSAGSSQNGIHFIGLNEAIGLYDLYVENHYIGFRLGTTSYSYIHNCVASNNYNDGFYFSNEDGVGTGCQYTVSKCLSQQNDGYGYSFHATTASMSVGDWLNLTTFANKLGGFNIQGTASYGVNAIRWVGGIVGEDGSHGVLFNSYNGSDHRISNVTFEIAGTAFCGRNLSTPATNQGNGVLITSNNDVTLFTSCVFIGNSWSGLSAYGSNTLVLGCDFRMNGAAALAGELAGILHGGGDLSIIGCRMTLQPYGIFASTDSMTAIANDFRGYTTAPIASSVSLVSSRIGSNRGISLITDSWGGGSEIEATVASAATADIGIAQSYRVSVTGTTAITSLGTVANRVKIVRFTGVLTLTHNATSLILPGAANITTSAGDTAVFASDNSGNWRCYQYTPAGGLASRTANLSDLASAAAARTNLGLTAAATASAGQLPATATNDSATAGNLGEIISSVVASGSALSLTTSTALNVTSLSLTPGDWDVDAVVQFSGNTTTTTSSWAGSISLTTATHDFTGGRGFAMTGNGAAYNQVGAGQPVGLPIPPVRISLASTTTIYLVASAIFGTSTASAYGAIRARRVR